MRSMIVAVCMAFGLAAAGAPQADARERASQSPLSQTAASQSAASQSTIVSRPSSAGSQQAGAGFERKCVIMSCGTPWCYSVRTN